MQQTAMRAGLLKGALVFLFLGTIVLLCVAGPHVDRAFGAELAAGSGDVELAAESAGVELAAGRAGVELETASTEPSAGWTTNLDTVQLATFPYTGSEVQPPIEVRAIDSTTHKSKTVSSANYDVVYQNNIDVGLATVKIIGKGAYQGFFHVSTFGIVGQKVYFLRDATTKSHAFTTSKKRAKSLEDTGFKLVKTYCAPTVGTEVHEFEGPDGRLQYASGATAIKRLVKAGYRDNGVAFHSDPRKTLSIAQYSNKALAAQPTLEKTKTDTAFKNAIVIKKLRTSTWKDLPRRQTIGYFASTAKALPKESARPIVELGDDVDFSMSEEAFVACWAPRIDAFYQWYESCAGESIPLCGHGNQFARAAYRNRIDPRLSPALSINESGAGRFCFRPHNAWGWGQSSWSSWAKAINGHAQGLASGYSGLTLAEVADKYCPGHSADYLKYLYQYLVRI